MKSALRSFAIATFVILFCLGIAWLYLKSKASSQPPTQALNNHYFEPNENFVKAVNVTEIELTQLGKFAPSTVFWIDVQITKDGKVIASRNHDFENPNYDESSPDRSPDTKLKTLSSQHLSFTDIQKTNPSVKLLERYFSEGNRRFIINVVSYPPNGDNVLSELISSKKVDQRIILQSEQDGVMSDLRKLKPMWLYGTSRAQIVQTLWLAGIGLEGLAPLKGDVLITPLHSEVSNQKTLLLTPELVNEAHRRSMKVLVGPASPDEVSEIKKLNVDGIVTSDTLAL